MNSKPRDFNYVSHKENFPLELKGTMKRRARPQSSAQINSQYTARTVSHISSTSQQTLFNKIMENYQDLKSVLPTDQSNISRRSCIKITNNQKSESGSGVAFLMSKQPVKHHHQKKHLMDKHQLESPEYLTNHRQKKHFPMQIKQRESIQETKLPKKHAVTLWKKIDNDLHSDIKEKQNFASGTVKMSSKNMFKEGIEIGFQDKRQPKMSNAKKRQIMGSGAFLQPENNRRFKNDWRKTSIIFG